MPDTSPSRPNVLVFFTDQQRHDTTGVHGCPLGLTPNFDRLARAGTDVHHSFTCQPVCGPARACLQTGTYASTNGTLTNNHPFDASLPTLGMLFRNAGYRTGYLGKYHLGEDGVHGPVAPERRAGYDDWLAANVLEMTSDAYHTRLWDEHDRPHDLPGYRVDAITDALIRKLDGHINSQPKDDAQPFFYFTSFLEPHHQNDVDGFPAPVGYRERYTGRWCPPDLAALPTHPDAIDHPLPVVGGNAHAQLDGYFGMVKRLDEALGRLCDALKSLGQLEDTVILFTADHACHFKTRNGEYKRSGHESSIRVPTMLHGGPFTGGGRVQELVSLVDLPPTLLDAAGIEIPDNFEGRSLLPLIRGDEHAKRGWPDDVYVQVSEMSWGRAIRTKRWKYIVTDPDLPGWAGGYDGSHARLVEAELYDLREDPHELVNLIRLETHTPVRSVMRERLKRRMEGLGETVPPIVEADTVPSNRRTVDDADANA